jgi:hypothetical protein
VADPVTTGLVVAGALGAAKQARDFIAAVSGHPGETIGTMLGNVANRRLKNVEAVSGKSHLILLDIGVEPSEVPLNILQPILEGASLQDDPNLQSAWANLLANAADGRQKNRVEPSFVAMLRNLSSREVRFLESLCSGADGLWNIQLGKHDTRRIYGGEANTFDIMMTLLQREGILESHEGSDVMVDRPRLHPFRTLANPEGFYTFTPLGIAFVRACRKPDPPTP